MNFHFEIDQSRWVEVASGQMKADWVIDYYFADAVDVDLTDQAFAVVALIDYIEVLASTARSADRVSWDYSLMQRLCCCQEYC